MTATATKLETRKITARIGAEVTGLRPACCRSTARMAPSTTGTPT
jgi:hypothetical protein